MNNLPRVLGPAPSELPFEVFVQTRLRRERSRVARSLELFRSGVVPSWNKKKKSTTTTKSKPRQSKAKLGREISSFLSETGLSPEEFRQLAQEAVASLKED